MTKPHPSKLLIVTSAMFAVALLAGLPGNAHGQEIVEPSARSYSCMARGPNTDGGRITMIVVPSPAVETMSAKGFTEFDCNREGFTLAQQVKFRDEICLIAAEQPEGMQTQLERVMGERPAVLCAMAEIVVGQWNAMEGRTQ